MKTIIIALLLAVAPFANKAIAHEQPIGKVLTAYFNLKNALTSDDYKTARASAKTMLDEIGKVSMTDMSKEQHEVWMKYSKKLSYDAQHISETDEIDHHREHFVTLSKNMIEVAKAFPSDESLYVQFCPMANDGKGAYWVSEKEKISNPYMGKKMPTCGSTKETIKEE